MRFAEANARYEARLRAVFGDAVVETDLTDKHEKMAKSAFHFLRATCFRWAQRAEDLCPDLAPLSCVGSVVDAHVGNFGLWRNARAHLVCGVNDYDEAAMTPWPFDLVRLAASAELAFAEADLSKLTDAIVAGYQDGLASPAPLVLERDHLWLREAFIASEDDRLAFWSKLDEAEPAPCKPRAFDASLLAALGVASAVRIAPRSAGVGSLGRPRFVARGQALGGPVAAEIKGVLPSAWTKGRRAGLADKLAHGLYRSPDPSLHYTSDHVVRRLAPDNGKIAFDKLAPAAHLKLVAVMAADLAAIHAHGGATAIISGELAGLGNNWLRVAARTVVRWTKDEWAQYKDG